MNDINAHFREHCGYIPFLEKVGKDFGVEFMLPPFNGDLAFGFFNIDINKFKKRKNFQEFIGIINESKINYEYAFKDEKKKEIFLIIEIK